MKIILVDDHALFRGGFALLFQQLEAGAEVLEADGMDAAMGLVALHPDADLMLLDLGMPGMNGQEGIKWVTEACPQLPVIVLSACETRNVVRTVMAAGALGFISKSSSPPVMQSAIRLVLSGGVYLPPQLLNTEREEGATAGATDHDGPAKLTERQQEVLRLLVAGMSNKQICRELDISEGTVKSHITSVCSALGAVNRTEAAVAALRLRMFS